MITFLKDAWVKRIENEKSIKVVNPCPTGWLEKKLNEKEMDYLWRCIDKRGKASVKDVLAGHIKGSYALTDKSDWFFLHVIKPLIYVYEQKFRDLGRGATPLLSKKYPYEMQTWWVNYQKQNEFNPFHDHAGVYSFVIWMKIPTHHDKQNLSNNANTDRISLFEFHWIDIIGNFFSTPYMLDPSSEGTMLLFPAKLNHQVYPFYNCDEERISISGNITLNTARAI